MANMRVSRIAWIAGCISFLLFPLIARADKYNPYRHYDYPGYGESAPSLSPSAGTPAKQHEMMQKADTAGEDSEYWMVFRHKVKVTDSLLCLFTLLLFAATVLLWRSTRSLVNGAENTARQQLKAYVFIKAARVEKHPSGAGHWLILLKLKNYGSTPARDVLVKIEKRFPIPETKEILHFSDQANTHTLAVIPPQGLNTFTINFDELPRDWNDWAQLRNKNLKGYIFGRIDYRDAFDKPRWLTFQMIHHFGLITDFAYCKVGNDSDKTSRKASGFLKRLFSINKS